MSLSAIRENIVTTFHWIQSSSIALNAFAKPFHVILIARDNNFPLYYYPLLLLRH